MDALFRRHGGHSAHADEVITCENHNEYSGKLGLRILAVFIILISSGIGSLFPLLSSRYSAIRLPGWCFFIAKFFGSGVIVATAFIHLLEPATDLLGNPCLGGTFSDYPWAFGICLMSLFALFFVEIISHHSIKRRLNSLDGTVPINQASVIKTDDAIRYNDNEVDTESRFLNQANQEPGHKSYVEFSRDPESSTNDPVTETDEEKATVGSNKANEEYLNQMISVCILEAGIIFHSIFIGLSLAVSGEEFITLFVVLVFHQIFEGLGLGTRLAEARWPQSKWYIPWLLAFGFSISTPLAIAIGLGVRSSFAPESRKSLITNGVFDAISAGILIYTGLVELMAFEFLYSDQFRGPSSLRKLLTAFAIMCCGAGLMALLGKWA